MGRTRGGRTIIIDKLMDYHGYSRAKATRIVKAVIDFIKEMLIQGRNVKLPGLGLLIICNRTQYRKKASIINGRAPMMMTILTINKQGKSIELIKGVKLDG